ncbi:MULTISPECIES: NUDIX hydrolase [Alphaproteobacteria]|uniref:Hydrolase n=2 Tax=Alphaproteobacteria TaxID=28211 RepID=A0A512HLU6_9HYPH|nr:MULTISPECIES: NUDIX hydrolase [Alphaproteobacteria]GEO86409.1 hydrolase [Ciceribacter naphthalenivorans]GLR22287.1 hydrolase [Ciceribacter naphthalenivorans]GLT05143.1 hydrolase [Sphingomonas psychrolutea]
MTSHPFEEQDRASQAPARLRPRDAASLLLIDRSATAPRVLVGKRGSGHAFMPNLYVFPGGRRDRGDSRQPFMRDLDPLVLAKLCGDLDNSTSLTRGRGLALAALRELEEETGLVIGQRDLGRDRIPRLRADLGSLRYVARAITPPGNVRRFDTRFFLTFTDEAGVDPTAISDSTELHDLRWLDMHDLSGLNMPSITKTILNDVKAQMTVDPSLPFGTSVPFYFSRRGRFFREVI